MPSDVSSIGEASSAAAGRNTEGLIDAAKSLASRLWPALLLVGLFWVVRYWHSDEFGLYEDDLTHLPIAAAMSPSELVDFVFDAERNLNLYGNGRPIHYTFIYTLTNLGWRLSDLQGSYWVAFALQAFNLILLYSLLKRVHSKAFGVLGGLAYVLYSADTTQSFLTLAFGMHSSFTMLLLASYAYLSGKRWLAYPLAALMLFTYETPYTVFLAVPLLAYQPGRKWLRRFALHGLILGLIFIGAILIRSMVGEGRLADLGLWEMVSIPLIHMLEGPIVSLGTYLYRPLQAIQFVDLEVALASVAAFALAAILLSRLDIGTPPEVEPGFIRRAANSRSGASIRERLNCIWAALPQDVRMLVRLAATGLLMLVLAYPLTFTVRAYAISGRDTRVHSAGAFGASVLIGAMLLLVLWVAESYGRRRLVSVVAAACFGLMVGYGFVIQRDYRRAWEYQRSFWSELVQLIPDVGEGTAIVVDPSGLQDTRQIGANYWNLPRVLDQIYTFPADWEKPPRVYRLEDGWEGKLLLANGMLILDPETTFAPPSTHGIVDAANAIFIETTGGKLNRPSAPWVLGEQEIWLRSSTDIGEPDFQPGFLYRYLIEGASNER